MRKNSTGPLWLVPLLLLALNFSGCATKSPVVGICPEPQPIPASLLTPPSPQDWSKSAQIDIQQWRTTLMTARAALEASSASPSPLAPQQAASSPRK